MKVTSIVFGILISFYSGISLAALQCTDFKCDVKWKTNMGEVDLSSVCYNFKGKSEYQECRKLAVNVFTKRCEKGKNNNNQTWVDIYCGALKKYKP